MCLTVDFAWDARKYTTRESATHIRKASICVNIVLFSTHRGVTSESWVNKLIVLLSSNMYTDVWRQKAGSTTPVQLCKQMYFFQSFMHGHAQQHWLKFLLVFKFWLWNLKWKRGENTGNAFFCYHYFHESIFTKLYLIILYTWLQWLYF